MNSSFSMFRCGHKTLLAVLAGSVFLLTAPAHAAPRQWEYAVENAKLTNRALAVMLNSYGKQGWELVQINHQGVAIFKRAAK